MDSAIDAARACFLEHGVAGASVEDLRAATGLSTGSIYHRWASKEGLAAAVYVDALGDFQRAFVYSLRAHDDAEGGVRAGVRAHLRWCLRDAPERARFLLFQGDAARGAADGTLSDLNRAFLDDVTGWWRPHVRYGAVRDLPLEVVEALWLGPAHEYARLRLAGRARATRNAARALEDAAWLSLRSQGAES